MSMIQLRNVPEDMHRELKVRAAQRGLTLSDYATEELRKSLRRPDQETLFRRIASRDSVSHAYGAEVVRADRDAGE